MSPRPKTPPDDPLALERQLCLALYAAGNLVTRVYRPLLEPLGLTYPQYLVMLALWQASPRTVSELGAALDLDSGTLTPLLKRLEAAGLVSRKRDPADERRLRVELTPKGQALREAAKTVPEALACEVGLPGEDLARLRGDLQALVTRLRWAQP